jgi:hypothetical protein
LETDFPCPPGLQHLADQTPSKGSSHLQCRTPTEFTYHYQSFSSEVTTQNAQVRNERVIRAIVGPTEALSEVALVSILRRFIVSDEAMQNDIKDRTRIGEGRYGGIAIRELLVTVANDPKTDDPLAATLNPLVIAGLANAPGTLLSPKKYVGKKQN